ncbi:MAG: sulfurtransferase complex subunit TusD [Psychrobacter sp.]|nr:sulfurtransferase complex subunit TusD [Psychrobacter sp.]
MTTPLLLITKDPSHPLAHLALRYAQAYFEQVATMTSDSNQAALKLFFYADAAHIANRLRWQSADQINLTEQWQALAQQHNISLPVCVSTALSRGISDTDNSARHQLQGDNLAQGFELVGLSELAMMMQNCRLIQF